METMTEATAVMAAAAGAAGVCPETVGGRQAWEQRVRSLAEFLWAEAAALQARAAMVAKEVVLTGTVTAAEEHPTNGRGRVVVDTGRGRGPDAMWTPFLSGPEGRALLEEAKALVGQKVVASKRTERERPDSSVTHPRLVAIRPVDRPARLSGIAEPEVARQASLPASFVRRARDRFGLAPAEVHARAEAVLGSSTSELGPDELARLWDDLRSARA